VYGTARYGGSVGIGNALSMAIEGRALKICLIIRNLTSVRAD
jgi:hypothetical protein